MDELPTMTMETLIDYHFGTLPAEGRAAVEQRLLEDPAALRRYLELKRALDRPPDDDRPSSAARERLRAAVAAAHGPGWRRRLRRILRRPVPLYQTMALAAAVGLLAGVLGLHGRPGEPPVAPRPTLSGPMVDSSRTVPLSLQIF